MVLVIAVAISAAPSVGPHLGCLTRKAAEPPAKLQQLSDGHKSLGAGWERSAAPDTEDSF